MKAGPTHDVYAFVARNPNFGALRTQIYADNAHGDGGLLAQVDTVQVRWFAGSTTEKRFQKATEGVGDVLPTSMGVGVEAKSKS